jgi:hypothetical protein
MMYDQCMELLLGHFASGAYSGEVTEAKREFFEQAGIVDEDSAHFEVRMAQFLDWYIFSRELSREHLTPIQYVLDKPPFEVTEETRPYFEDMSNIKHSLYEFVKIKGTDITVRDLFEGKKITLKDSAVSAGFSPDEIFEARIIPSAQNNTFAKGFCFHPPEAKGFILKEIKKVKNLDKGQREALMLRLLKMRYKFEQYKHIRLEFIYTNDSKLRI